MSTQLVPLKEKVQSIRGMLDKMKPDLVAAMPRHINPERMLQLAVTAIRRNPKLADCTPTSLLGCIMQASQSGLHVSSYPPEAHLVPYKNRKTGFLECQLIYDYRGLMKLARQSDVIAGIEARPVHEGDAFVYEYGISQKLEHRPTNGDGPLSHVYALARFRDGHAQFEVMTKSEVEAIRKRSRAGEEGPWITDYEEMAKKTVVRRLCKYLPANDELAAAVTLDERAEAGLPQEIDLEIAGPETVDEKPAGKLQQLTEALSEQLESPPPPPNGKDVTSPAAPGAAGHGNEASGVSAAPATSDLPAAGDPPTPNEVAWHEADKAGQIAILQALMATKHYDPKLLTEPLEKFNAHKRTEFWKYLEQRKAAGA